MEMDKSEYNSWTRNSCQNYWFFQTRSRNKLTGLISSSQQSHFFFISYIESKIAMTRSSSKMSRISIAGTELWPKLWHFHRLVKVCGTYDDATLVIKKLKCSKSIRSFDDVY